jgi:phage terminase small subunit
MKPLHTRFVQEYLVDRNGAAAAVRAGYSQHTARQIAYELLTRPDVSEAVREGEAQIAAHAQVTRAAVLHGFQEAIELGRSRADPAAMIAGWREIAKMCGYYAPERKCVELSTAGLSISARVEKMSDAELANLIAGADEPATV